MQTPTQTPTRTAYPRPSLQHRARGYLIPLLGAFAMALAGLQLSAGPAQAVKPAGSAVELLHGSADPSLADTQGTNVGDWLGVNLYLAAGTTQEALGCAASDTLAEAIVATTADGSAERPVIPDDHTEMSSAFTWTTPANATSSGASSAVEGDAINGLQAFTTVYTHAGWTASPQEAAGQIWTMWPAGTALSLVLVCVTPDQATGEYIVRRGADGHALTSWVTFLTVASPTRPAQTSAGWQIVSPKTVPGLAVDATFVPTGTSGTATVTLAGTDHATLTDATGSVSLYAGENTSGTPVATGTVSSGVATLPLTGLTPGAVVNYTAVYTPDDAAATSYAPATSDTTTFTVPRPATATTTVLTVGGALTEGNTQTLTATVTPAATGTVAFTDSGAPLGTATVAAGTATLTRALAVGSHTLTAAFTPADAAYAPSTSEPKPVTITTLPTPALTITAARGSYGKATKATISVRAGATTATGRVTVALDGRTLTTATLTNGTGAVTLPATTAAGNHTLVATYAGSDTLAAATGRQTVAIAKAATRATVKLTPRKITRAKVKKGKVKATVTVTVPGTSVHATGTITVKIGTKTARGKLKANGTVIVKLPKVKKPKKKLTVVVSYPATANLAASTVTTTVKVKR